MKAFYVTGGNKGLSLGLLAALNGEEKVHVLSREKNRAFFYNHTKVDLSNIIDVSNFNFNFEKELTGAVLISNAGVLGEISEFGDLSSSSIIEAININVLSPVILMNQFIKAANNFGIPGVIVNITSGLVNYPIPNLTTYIGTKIAINGMVDLIAKERNANIELISIDPGLVETTMQQTLRNSNRKYVRDYFQKKYNEKRLSSPEVVGKKIINFVVSRNWKNGQTYHINEI